VASNKEGYRSYCHPDYFQPITPLVYHNDGNGHFTEVSQKIGLSKPGKGLGIANRDYDRDGHIDLFVANDSMVEFLYHNKGDGTFEEVGLLFRSPWTRRRTYAGMGVDFADYNNDGWPDLVITDLANQRYALYQNNGDSTFNYSSFNTAFARLHDAALPVGAFVFWITTTIGWKDLLVAQGHDLDTVELNYPQSSHGHRRHRQ